MLRLTLVLAICFSQWASLATADDWPQWRGPARTGAAPTSPPLIDKLPDAGLQPTWFNKEAASGGRSEGWSSPVVAAGRVYLFSHSRDQSNKENKEARVERLLCLDAESGEQLWETACESRKTNFQQSGTPTVQEGRVYVLGAGRVARCFDADSGDQLWQSQLPGEVDEHVWQASFAVVDGVAVVFAGRLVGIDAASGEVLWQGDDTMKEGVHGSPAVLRLGDAALVIANVGRGETVAVEARSGKQRWKEKTEAVNSTPLVLDDRLITYGHSRKGGVRCFKATAEGLEPLWQNQTMSDPGSSPVAVGDHLFVQGERKLACIRLSDGETEWTTELDMNQPRYTSPIAADGQVLYTFDRLLAFAASPEEFKLLYNGRIDRQGRCAEEASLREAFKVAATLDGNDRDQKTPEQRWRQEIDQAGPIGCTSPAIADGRLYLRLKQGVICYDLRKK
jgi:outer membrane protein assembly factor BamB